VDATNDKSGVLGVLIDMRYWRDTDGRHFTDDPMVRFVRAFRGHYERIVLIGRVWPPGASDIAAGATYRADGEGVSVVALPPYERIHALALRPWALWPQIERTLRATLPELDALWLNFGHPVSLRALRMCGGLPRLSPFAVLRGNYDRDAAFRAEGGRLRRKVTGLIAFNMMDSFARNARRLSVPCVGFGTGPRLAAYGLRHVGMVSSLLDAADIDTAADPDLRKSDVLVVGRLAREKGVDLLLDAMVQAPGKTLRIVGGGEEESALKAQARTLGLTDRVFFDGAVQFGPQLFARYQATRLVVIPSRTEGAPKAAFEAMAFGKPVIASAVGGLPNIVGSDGERGVLVEVGDTSALADAIVTSLDTPGWLEERRAAVSTFGGQVSMQRQVAQIAAFVKVPHRPA
jgi:hypothetical protein